MYNFFKKLFIGEITHYEINLFKQIEIGNRQVAMTRSHEFRKMQQHVTLRPLLAKIQSSEILYLFF